MKELALDENIRSYLGRYADFEFDIDYTELEAVSSQQEVETARHIKVSRGEENIFIWCFFMAICERYARRHPAYDWVKYLYIDDPISSLDDNNAIAVASDLAKLLREAKDRTKLVEVAQPSWSGAPPQGERSHQGDCVLPPRPVLQRRVQRAENCEDTNAISCTARIEARS